jgi:hypothetical protein
MAYIYHYHAVAHLGNERKVEIDDVITAALRIETQDRYESLKQEISKQHGVPDVAIRSLAFLHETEGA